VEERLPQRAAEMGEYLMTRLREIKAPHLKEIRGRGLLIGLELDLPARPYCEALMEHGILCKETHTHVIRLAPPLIIEREILDWAMEQLHLVFNALG